MSAGCYAPGLYPTPNPGNSLNIAVLAVGAIYACVLHGDIAPDTIRPFAPFAGYTSATVHLNL